MSKSFAQTIADRLKAGALVVIVQESDELLALAAVNAGAASCGTITVLSGSAPEATEALEKLPTDKGVLVLADFLSIYKDNPLTVRLIREVALQQRDEDVRYSRLILIESPSTEIPITLRGDVEVVAPPLPNVESLTEELDLFVDEHGVAIEGNGEARYAIASSVAGLARHEANRLFARCYVENDKQLDPAWLRKKKARKVADRLAGALTFENELSADVGGLENLKSWLGARRTAFGSAKAKAFGLPEPKGMLLLGVPGCGKSLTAKTVAREWGLPLLRLDAGKLFGSLVGQSEAQTRAAIEAAEACAPCVLWVDEIEKGLAGGGSGSGDSGTGARVFGTLLTWLQEKTAPVFVVATANKISSLPPELLRKGRFDEIFFVGLPTHQERREIVEIHLAKRKRKLKAAEITAIVDETVGFSGAELEQVIVEGMFQAYSKGRDLKISDVLEAAQGTSPLSKTMASEIEALTKWADGRARRATAPKKVSKKAPGRRGPKLTSKKEA